MLKLLKIAFIFPMVALFLASCASSPEDTEVATDGYSEDYYTEDQTYQDSASSNANEMMSASYRVYYFDFDRQELKPKAVEYLNAQIPVLNDMIQNDSSYMIRLNGHTDEWGTREYNLALGQRRADSVSRYLRARGIPASNIQTVSYGKERPASTESNREAWSQNRRVEMVLPSDNR